MHSPAAVLHEMMVKMGTPVEFQYLAQPELKHQSVFEYRCVVDGASTTGKARSKKEAKQLAARAMLQHLARSGHNVPPPYGDNGEAQMNPDTPPDRPSYVSLLNELYREYRLLGTVEYELVGEEGPPHLRQFTMRVRLACNEYSATAPTKKEARQLAAKRLYEHLRRNILRATGRFDEAEAEESWCPSASGGARRKRGDDEQGRRRVDLSQKVYDYPSGLSANLSAEKRAEAIAALKRGRDEPVESSDSTEGAGTATMTLSGGEPEPPDADTVKAESDMVGDVDAALIGDSPREPAVTFTEGAGPAALPLSGYEKELPDADTAKAESDISDMVGDVDAALIDDSPREPVVTFTEGATPAALPLSGCEKELPDADTAKVASNMTGDVDISPREPVMSSTEGVEPATLPLSECEKELTDANTAKEEPDTFDDINWALVDEALAAMDAFTLDDDED